MPAAEKQVPSSRSQDARRSNKPIMEKRRRARINHCLLELKSLILEALKKDPARHSKLEKADILEMTVRHLQNVQRQQMALAVATDPGVMTKFRAGFNECAAEVARYVGRIDGVDAAVRQRLLNHLRHCLTGLNSLSPAQAFGCLVPGLPNFGPALSLVAPVHVDFQGQQQSHAAAAPPFVTTDTSASRLLYNIQSLQLFPGRLQGNDVTFLLPTSQTCPATVTPSSASSASISPSDNADSKPVGAPSISAGSALLTMIGRQQPSITTTTTTIQRQLTLSTAASYSRCPEQEDRRTPSAFAVVPKVPKSVGSQGPPCCAQEDLYGFTDASDSDAVSSDDESLECVVTPKKQDGPSSGKTQTEAYDLSQPSTSNVGPCCLPDSDKMWRPW